MIALLALINTPNVRAASGVTFIPGTTAIDAALQDSLGITLQNASADTNGAHIFAVTAAQGTDAWKLVSIAGFTQLTGESWSLEDAAWVGLALAVRNKDGGTWTSALKEQPDFTTLLTRVPDADLDASARAGLSPNRRPLTADQTTYRFPWQPGTSMYYGSRGVHPGDYAGLGAYKAVDFLSDGDTSVGHAPNKLLAAASGTIDFVCNGTSNTAIRIGNVMYLHLDASPSPTLSPILVSGRSFKQGEMIGQLKTGPFNDLCGWAIQDPNWFHVHWSFPDTSSTTGMFQSGGWTLTFTDQTWRRGTDSRIIGSWMRADPLYYSYLPLIINRIQ
jgi:hypothetical protein